MSIVKTGYCIDGIEVTSEHIGKKLEVLKSGDGPWLPAGFVTTIEKVYDDGVIDLHDAGGEDSYYSVELDSDHWKFKWATPAKPEASTKPQRMRLAETIRDAKAALDLAVRAAEEVGMVVKLYEDGVDITFTPPAEEY